MVWKDDARLCMHEEVTAVLGAKRTVTPSVVSKMITER